MEKEQVTTEPRLITLKTKMCRRGPYKGKLDKTVKSNVVILSKHRLHTLTHSDFILRLFVSQNRVSNAFYRKIFFDVTEKRK